MDFHHRLLRLCRGSSTRAPRAVQASMVSHRTGMSAIRSERHIEDSARMVFRLSELAGSGGWRLGHGISGARVYAMISSRISVGRASRPCAMAPLDEFDRSSVL